MRISLLLLAATTLYAAPVTLEYMGTAGWRITNGQTIILIDPYLTRAKSPSPNDDVAPDDPRPLVNGNSVVNPDSAVIDAHIRKADYIFLTHTHSDHSLDMPYIALKTGAKVFGTQSTANVARAEGVPEKQIRVVNPGEEVTLEGFTVKVIHSLHGIFRRPPPGAYTPPNPPLVPDGVKGPLRFGQHVEGGTLAYLFRIGGHQILVFGSMNFVESELVGIRPDVALIGAMPERNNLDDYTPRIMKVLGNPPLVIPTHWDRFNVTYAVSQEPAVKRLQSFLDEVHAASPETTIIVPEYFKPIPLPEKVR
jgi:L-ascorbate metabolism protein UlaG (beta-lactamase superfamily)